MRESEIQRKIAEKLGKSGWLVIKLERTNWNGIPDLMALRNGKAIFIEVKTDKGVVAELQKHRIETLNRLGFYAIVARDMKDIETLCYK